VTVRLLSAGVRWEYVVGAGFHGDVSSDVEDVEGAGGGVVVLVAGGRDVEAGGHALAWFELSGGDLLGELVGECGVSGAVGGLCPGLGGAGGEEGLLVVPEGGDQAGWQGVFSVGEEHVGQPGDALGGFAAGGFHRVFLAW
jgi:hypothetical protein